jgi:outer membrane protein assembly factor BamB
MVQFVLSMAARHSDGKPQISSVIPSAAIPGGDFYVHGKGFGAAARPRVHLGETAAPLVVGSDSFLVARVPDGAAEGEMVIHNGSHRSAPWICEIGLQIAEGVHPVANPAIDGEGNVFTTLSGQRGQKTPVSVYKVDTNYHRHPFVSDLMNATGLAFDADGTLYVSSRNDGVVYQVTPRGSISVYVEGMGTATGLAFDAEGNLYVGDRSGTIFKVNPSRQVFVFATIEPSMAAYHLAFGRDGYLYVTGPTTSSFDCVHRISPAGDVSVYYRGLGRPQGLAFDAEGRLYVAASLAGRRGVVRITDGTASLFLSGPGIVGLAFTPSSSMIVATSGALFRVETGVRGMPLPMR